MVRVKSFTKKLEKLKELVDIQCTDGNWNYDPYMQGMANGMLLSVSVFDDKEPEFKEAPKVWLKDKKAQITRIPSGVDFGPGVAEVTPNVMWQGAPAEQRTRSVQTDQWANSIPTIMSDGLTEEQLYQVMSRLHGISREELEQLREKYKRHTIIAPIIQAVLSDGFIKSLVGDSNDKDPS